MTRALAVLMALTASSAIAQGNCAPRDRVASGLANLYGERLAAGGLQDSSEIFEVWVNDEKGTWTILRTNPNGQTCIMASGSHWRDVEPVPLGDES